jgi:hypothetical protein
MTHSTVRSSGSRRTQLTAREARPSEHAEQLKAANDTIRDLNTTILTLRQTLRDALEDCNTAEALAVLYNLASKLHEGLYRRKCEEAENKDEEESAGAAASEKAICDLGHQYVAVLIKQALSQESPQN